MIVDALVEYKHPVFVYIPPNGEFRAGDQKSKMHQLDPVLMSLDEDLEMAGSETDVAEINEQIKDREAALMPLYLQVAHEFADLHDRAGRMKAKGVIRDKLEWKSSRAYMYWRVKRRIAEDELRGSIMAAAPHLDHAAATDKVVEMVGETAYDSDQGFLEKIADEGFELPAQLKTLKLASITATVKAMMEGLDASDKAAIMSGL